MLPVLGEVGTEADRLRLLHVHARLRRINPIAENAFGGPRRSNVDEIYFREYELCWYLGREIAWRDEVTRTDLEAKRSLTRYRMWLMEQPLARSTRVSYGRKTSRFVHWLEDAGLVDKILASPEIPNSVVQDFADALRLEGYAHRTVNVHLAAVNHFLSFLGMPATTVGHQDLIATAPLTLSTEEQRHVLSTAKDRGSPRDSAVLAIALFAGLRLAEMATLNVAAVKLTEARGHVDVRAPSGNSSRHVPLNTHARASLSAWLNERPAWPGAEGEALFLSRRGRRLSVRAIHMIVQSFGAAAGVDLSPQVLRHTFVTSLLRAGTDLTLAAELAGHRRTETTRRYRPATVSDREAAVEAIFISTEP